MVFVYFNLLLGIVFFICLIVILLEPLPTEEFHTVVVKVSYLKPIFPLFRRVLGRQHNWLRLYF